MLCFEGDEFLAEGGGCGLVLGLVDVIRDNLSSRKGKQKTYIHFIQLLLSSHPSHSLLLPPLTHQTQIHIHPLKFRLLIQYHRLELSDLGLGGEELAVESCLGEVGCEGGCGGCEGGLGVAVAGGAF